MKIKDFIGKHYIGEHVTWSQEFKMCQTHYMANGVEYDHCPVSLFEPRHGILVGVKMMPTRTGNIEGLPLNENPVPAFCVKMGWMNKEILVPEVKSCSEDLTLPIKYVTVTERDKEWLRKDCLNWPRDEKGRWI